MKKICHLLRLHPPVRPGPGTNIIKWNWTIIYIWRIFGHFSDLIWPVDTLIHREIGQDVSTKFNYILPWVLPTGELELIIWIINFPRLKLLQYSVINHYQNCQNSLFRLHPTVLFSVLISSFHFISKSINEMISHFLSSENNFPSSLSNFHL